MSAAAAPVVEVRADLSVVEADRFDFFALIREVLAESTDPDPAGIASVVAERIPDDALRDVVARLLPAAVRVQIHTDRLNTSREKSPQPEAGSRRWKQASVLALRVNVPGKRWMLLGECSPKELADIVAGYKASARHNIEQAKRYTRLLERVQARKAKTVADLGEAEAREVFGA